ncbi:hypothetical protein [Nonomuraea sp. NPDC049309]|uniref:hypothetical protein n=1 Tax=Nonomuraea sp. NPDC049309 TaxID=3364350 RepID=UPI003713AF64
MYAGIAAFDHSGAVNVGGDAGAVQLERGADGVHLERGLRASRGRSGGDGAADPPAAPVTGAVLPVNESVMPRSQRPGPSPYLDVTQVTR